MLRCIHCARTQDQHAPETQLCVGSAGRAGQKFATRDLPLGVTCADCAHFKRTCEWLLDYKGTETACDWWPIRFHRLPDGGPSEVPKEAA